MFDPNQIQAEIGALVSRATKRLASLTNIVFKPVDVQVAIAPDLNPDGSLKGFHLDIRLTHRGYYAIQESQANQADDGRGGQRQGPGPQV